MKQNNSMLDGIDLSKMTRVSRPSTFVLIKEYPNSPKIGTVAAHTQDNKYRYEDEHAYGEITIDVLKNSPEFWEEQSDLIFLKPNLLVHENETVYGLLPKNMWQCVQRTAHHASTSSAWLWFKTESERDTYKQMNMPVLSINDVEKCFMNSRISSIPVEVIVPKVKQYLNNKQS